MTEYCTICGRKLFGKCEYHKGVLYFLPIIEMVEKLKKQVKLRRIKGLADKGNKLAKAIESYEKSWITKDKLMSIYFQIR